MKARVIYESENMRLRMIEPARKYADLNLDEKARCLYAFARASARAESWNGDPSGHHVRAANQRMNYILGGELHARTVPIREYFHDADR